MNLRPAEIKVIQMLCEGCAIKEIAHRLEKNHRTVGHQIFQAKQRTGARTTVHLCVMFAKEVI